MKKIIFSAVLMFVALFFLIVKLGSQGTSATQTPTPSTSSLSVTKNMGTSTLNQKQTTASPMAVRPQASRMTRTS